MLHELPIIKASCYNKHENQILFADYEVNKLVETVKWKADINLNICNFYATK